MTKYHKINTIFKRDMDAPGRKKPLIYGDWTCPEFEYLQNCEWMFTEKVDGTNIRLMFDDSGNVEIGGKTDRALIPAQLNQRLREYIARWTDEQRAAHAGLVLYGEGYGAGIQKGGNYRKDQSFVLFDVRAGHWWLRREDVENIADNLCLAIVPIVGRGALHNAIKMVSLGFSSRWGNFPAEGIVARPAVELKARSGERIICKIKARDFS